MNDQERQALLARLYELEYLGHTEDIEFYVQYALALDPERDLPILELGCGTGRVLLGLAEKGFHVSGVDASEAMLNLCRVRARERGLTDRIDLKCADMRHSGDLPPGRYNMAFCALNTFAYLQTTEDQLAMFKSARSALVQHGILIVDLTPPNAHLLPPSDGEVVYQASYPDPGGAFTAHKFVTGYAEPHTQTHRVRLFYDIEAADGALSRVSVEEVFRWTGRYEMELLLRASGFALEHVYGSYELDDYGEGSERMIFVART